jgi:hypothetical protein
MVFKTLYKNTVFFYQGCHIEFTHRDDIVLVYARLGNFGWITYLRLTEEIL